MEVDSNLAGHAFARGLEDTGAGRTNRFTGFEEWSKTALPTAIAAQQNVTPKPLRSLPLYITPDKPLGFPPSLYRAAKNSFGNTRSSKEPNPTGGARRCPDGNSIQLSASVSSLPDYPLVKLTSIQSLTFIDKLISPVSQRARRIKWRWKRRGRMPRGWQRKTAAEDVYIWHQAAILSSEKPNNNQTKIRYNKEHCASRTFLASLKSIGSPRP